MSRLVGDNHDVVGNRDFQIVLIAGIVTPLGTSLVSPILDSLRDPFSVSATEVGLMITAFTAPGIVLIVLGGFLADTYGRKPVLSVGLLLFGTSGVLIAFTESFGIALALRFLQGAGLSGITPVLITIVGDLFSGERETTAQGMRFGVSGLLSAVFPVFAGILVVVAWQYPFYLYGLSIPLAGLSYLFLSESRTPSTDDQESTSSGSVPLEYVVELSRQCLKTHVFSFLVARFTPVFVYIGFLTYVSIVVVELVGGTPRDAGIIVGIVNFVYALTAIQAGRINSMISGHTITLVGANSLLCLGFLVVLYTPSVLVAALGAILIGVGFGFILSLYRSIISKLASVQYRGGLVGAGEAVGRVGATFAPVFLGGVITLAEPIFGFQDAIRYSLGGSAVAFTVIGCLSVLVMIATSPEKL
ncbi:MFS transporter [Natrarchaeobius chitinivorans]|uniref:MFS transporter n=1 Tax=Natrarchaeobius chitinivorans TaxID=1679083 RepID=UPI0014047772|nr:MFS transporter [Natrarchaeobius chitinivorans]